MAITNIRTLLLTAGSALVIALAAPVPDTTEAADEMRRQIHAFDMSDSYLVAVHDRSAQAAGAIVARYVAALSPGDEVWLRSFGLAGAMDREINVTVTMGSRVQERPSRMAPAIGNLVASIPERVRGGELSVQNRTNIIGFLQAVGASLDCQVTRTTLVLFTDGIEWSTQVRGDALLAGTASLPAPSARFLDGCHVEMRGLGQVSDTTTDSRWFPILRDQWAAFFEAAGAASFRAYATFD